jgi:hypothetical protein
MQFPMPVLIASFVAIVFLHRSFASASSVALGDENSTNSATEDETAMHGACFTVNNERKLLSIADSQRIEYTDLLIDHQANHLHSEIYCLWFRSNADAMDAEQHMDIQAVTQRFQFDSEIQLSMTHSSVTIQCQGVSFLLSASAVRSHHLCSLDHCTEDYCEQGVATMDSSMMPSTVETAVPSSDSPIGVSAIMIVGILLAVILFSCVMYRFVCKYRAHIVQQSGKKEAADNMLSDIAKYTIGDSDDEKFYEDWMNSDNSSSSDNLAEYKINVVSGVSHLPRITNLDILSSSSSSDEQFAPDNHANHHRSSRSDIKQPADTEIEIPNNHSQNGVQSQDIELVIDPNSATFIPPSTAFGKHQTSATPKTSALLSDNQEQESDLP